MAKSRYPEPEGPRRRPAMGRADRSVTTWSGNRRWVLALVALPAGLIGLIDASVDFIAAPGLWPALWTLLVPGLVAVGLLAWRSERLRERAGRFGRAPVVVGVGSEGGRVGNRRVRTGQSRVRTDPKQKTKHR